MHHVVRVESSYNPYAIGVVGGHLVRQPKTAAEALATVRMLESRGYNFSLGLAQVNRYNMGKYGLNSYEKAFETCPNLQAGSRILAECYSRSGGDWGKSFSCYYSGNFITGYRHGYVQKIYASMRGTDSGNARNASTPAIEVVSRPSRRAVEATRYPVYAHPHKPGAHRIVATLPQHALLQSPEPVATDAPIPDSVFPGVSSQIVQINRLQPAVVDAESTPPSSGDDAFVF